MYICMRIIYNTYYEESNHIYNLHYPYGNEHIGTECATTES